MTCLDLYSGQPGFSLPKSSQTKQVTTLPGLGGLHSYQARKTQSTRAKGKYKWSWEQENAHELGGGAREAAFPPTARQY